MSPFEKKAASLDPKVILAKPARGEALSSIARTNYILTGRSTRAVFYIQKGKLRSRSFRTGQGGGRGNNSDRMKFFGEACIAGQVLRLATVSLSRSPLLSGSRRDTMVQLLREQEAFSQMFTSHILQRTMRVEAT